MVLWPSRDLLQLNTELPVKTSRRLSYSGDLNIESQMDKGTRISLEIPIKKLSTNKIIHIDDEFLLRKSWKKFFNERGIEVLSYSSPSDYNNNKAQVFENIPIFIDSYMGDEQRGETFAQELSKVGFNTIYLSSADIEHFNTADYPWLSGFLGKSAQDSLNILLN
jgi:hypothetical protein